MQHRSTTCLELICVIVDAGCASRVLTISRELGVTGGTIFYGSGTARSRLLDFLELSSVRREIVLMAAREEVAKEVLDTLGKKLNLHKKYHGIAFTMPIRAMYGSVSCRVPEDEEGEEETMTHSAIYTIVDKGKAEAVIEAAAKAGARGGTIINARGSGIHETERLFHMEIEPEKEIALIVAKNENLDPIIESIRKELALDEPGNGILFVQDVKRTYGLR
ncbi:P-II family nitrogen regulator [Youngiibacter fragilis]|uniref:Nitrogen regulatory protein P-II n=1 Tax=Youngiibacter fragilis 232.1 TaxID=994573 RepID=V7IAV7_9CLOT|nr:P-II family nitrogen regulator [Youngiibacter fragilis]ETA82479.1 nitrogen regulatory protein P-II [Youngiibacter fragilis 232.1]